MKDDGRAVNTQTPACRQKRPTARRPVLALATLPLLGVFAARTPASDWPQLQYDPQRTGFTRDEVAPPFKAVWYYNFQPERVSRHVQVVTHRGHVFVSTQMGNVYAFAARDGKISWKTSVGSPVLQTAACADGRVIVAALDGRIHALDASDGSTIWAFEAPGRRSTFSQAPCVAEGKVFIASRQGVFFALDLAEGKMVWKRDLGVPSYNTAAYNNGRVYIGAEDVRLRALDARTGNVIWTSEKLYGQSMREHHPVVTGGYVLARPMLIHPSREYFNSNYGKDPAKRLDYIFQATWNRPWQDVAKGGPVTEEAVKMHPQQGKLGEMWRDLWPEVKAGKMPETLLKAQDEMVEHYKKNPHDQDFFVLNESDGKQAFIAPHFHCSSLPGTVCPPAATSDGTVVIPWIYMSHVWARFDLKRQRVVEIMVTPRLGNGDETLNVSVGGKYLYVFHMNEIYEAAQYNGIFNFETKKWTDLGPRIPKRMWQLTDACESGGAAPAISDGHVYHVVFNQLAAYASAR